MANLFAYSQARSAVVRTAMEYNIKMMGLIKQNLRLSSDRGRNFVDELLVDPLLRTALRDFESLDDSEKNNMIREIARAVRLKVNMLEYIEDTRLVTPDNTQIYSLSHRYIHPEILNEDFLKIQNSSRNELWYFSDRKGRPVIHLSRKIIHIGTLEAQGYLLLTIDMALINNPKIRFTGYDRLQLMLIDPFGNTFHYGEDTSSQLDQTVIETITTAEQTGSITRFTGDKKQFICYFRDPDLDWTVVSYIPYTDLYLSAESILWTTILMAALLLGICLGISHIIIRSITQPLNALVNSVNRASTVKFDTPLADEADDELGYMAKAYNNVVLEVKDLITQVEGEQIEKRKAEVKMLQAQINPHFLFNTLDSLRFAATMSNASSVSDGLSALSHLLRNSIVSNKPVISMEQEVKNIRDYLTIQAIRYGNCIDFSVSLDGMITGAKIMKLLLQPIVENSVIHGLKDDDSDIRITLHATMREGMTVITISDNGRGFDPEEKIDRSTNRFKSSKFSGIGLENVRERLRLQYGESQRFSLESRPGEGTTVRIAYSWELVEGAQHV
ncbi:MULTISPECIES: sensor histidine kinase [unclassified Oceanispirochaeta]|uniref:sensor histidine kinase n=1 Tax=unclassified Oceanispirochaeta TaxID=2635722 RepID=UPI000E157A2E|nr:MULTISPECIES: sensor histidine kinase [unclassified Oceanispirochaeta]MBF9017002.1 sensor histidine kinase [Oceanispirochaeta sp. M2]NPD73365.1 sensor histidine kinase [Oceanispirochaeta sp. M1]RDG31023.1 sensor histidine kinase [Oceanispirochaeta sp. M1]